ncbi:aldo/keto reductase [Parachitinimonas caeni]|uniref:Aldo/keto reductase n=1 Tax=Parachitinimonas caeni TaxID=3031301 RepID=A0ABT7E6T5_9NEIS|nr:aldo/keto reductase [Parachitinimonas caeni]MDK2126627.1 aldo/keto reductase [Parachitinimonas caeni]
MSTTDVVFGLDGRTREQIESAIDIGYRRFDGADSYGNIELLAEALSNKGVEKKEIDLIYKVSTTPADRLSDHIKSLNEQFGGQIDHLLIHKADDDRAESYIPVLKELSKDGLVKAIGIGDVTHDMDHLLIKDSWVKSFEINAVSLLRGEHSEELCKKLQDSGKPVFIYNIVDATKSILRKGTPPENIEIAAIVNFIQDKVSRAEPILSSGSSQRQLENANATEIDDRWNEINKAKNQISSSLTPPPDIPVKDFINIEDNVLDRIKEVLATQASWDGEKLFDKSEDCERAKNEALGKFQPEELSVVYKGAGKAENEEYSIGTLVDMLYRQEGNCKRVEAYNFIATSVQEKELVHYLQETLQRDAQHIPIQQGQQRGGQDLHRQTPQQREDRGENSRGSPKNSSPRPQKRPGESHLTTFSAQSPSSQDSKRVARK